MFFKKRTNKAPTKKTIARTKRRFEKAIVSSQLANAVGLSDEDEGKVIEKKGRLKFVNRSSKFVKRFTLIIFLLFIVFFVVAFVINNGTYLIAWIFSLVLATLIIAILSFPKNLTLTEDELVINCVLETRVISLSEIKRIHTINRYRLKSTIPTFGSYGFGGYFGIYFDLIHFRKLRLFATNLQNLVYVQTIYKDHFILSCENSNLLIERTRDAILKLKPEEVSLHTDSWDEDDL
ncbi:MAG: PH domain-containing protein [Rikenellaceae bacterium]